MTAPKPPKRPFDGEAFLITTVFTVLCCLALVGALNVVEAVLR